MKRRLPTEDELKMDKWKLEEARAEAMHNKDHVARVFYRGKVRKLGVDFITSLLDQKL